MKPSKHLARVGLSLCMVMGTTTGTWATQAVAGRGTPLAAETPRVTTKPAGAPAVSGSQAPTLDLVRGTVVSVDVARATLVLEGQTVRWHPTQLKVFNAVTGAVGHVTQLQRGMAIRFALEPGAAPDRRIVLMYLEAQP